MTVIFSRRDPVEVAPEGTGRTYRIAPLSFRERQAMYADLVREGGAAVQPPQRRQAMREALAELAPGNLDALLEVIDAVEALTGDAETPEAKALLGRLAVIEAAAVQVPAYAEIVGRVHRRTLMMPVVALRHALRGWDGPGLPPFARIRGLLPDDLADLLPPDEAEQVGWAAWSAAHPDPATEKNFVAPSPSPGTPAPMTAG